MAHVTTYITVGHPAGFVYARCKCGWRAEPRPTQQSAEDDARKHEKYVERIRCHLGVKRPTLRSQRDYYRQMADNEEVDPEDRRLWKHLADELDARLNEAQPEQAALFEMAAPKKSRSDIS